MQPWNLPWVFGSLHYSQVPPLSLVEWESRGSKSETGEASLPKWVCLCFCQEPGPPLAWDHSASLPAPYL